eukprot:2572512-Amphidinium_carterae.1
MTISQTFCGTSREHWKALLVAICLSVLWTTVPVPVALVWGRTTAYSASSVIVAFVQALKQTTQRAHARGEYIHILYYWARPQQIGKLKLWDGACIKFCLTAGFCMGHEIVKEKEPGVQKL